MQTNEQANFDKTDLLDLSYKKLIVTSRATQSMGHQNISLFCLGKNKAKLENVRDESEVYSSSWSLVKKKPKPDNIRHGSEVCAYV